MARIGGVLRRAWRSSWTSSLLFVALIVTSAGWIARLRPFAVVWGDVATWVAGVGTVLALMIAAGEFKRSSEEFQRSSELARLERQEAMVTQYLADAYLAVCKVAGTPGGFYTTDEVVGDLENAINAAELFGSTNVREEARKVIDECHRGNPSLELGSIKYALRDELRERLVLQPVTEKTTHLGFLTGPRFVRTKEAQALLEQHKHEIQALLAETGQP
jgi:hypothetical protein